MATADDTHPVTIDPECAERMDDPMSLIRMAVEYKDIDALSRLIALKREYDADIAKRAYVTAIAAAKADLPSVVSRSKAVDFVTKTGMRVAYKHAELGDICAAVVPILARYGISYAWTIEQPNREGVSVTCCLTHSGGHMEHYSISGPIDTSGLKNPLQAIASAVTYLQRYTLRSALGLAEHDADDDGRDTHPRTRSAPQCERTEPSTPPTDKQVNRLRSLSIDPRISAERRAWLVKILHAPLEREYANRIIYKAKESIEAKTGKPYEPYEDGIPAENAPPDDSELDDESPERVPGEEG